MRWSAFFHEIGKHIDVGKQFYKEFWLESIIFWGVCIIIMFAIVFLHAQIKYKRKNGKWFNVKRLWK